MALRLDASAWILLPSRLIVPKFEHARLLCQQEHLDEVVLQILQEGASKAGQRIVIGM